MAVEVKPTPTPHSEYAEDRKPTERPSAFSNAWYREQFRGVMHSLNRCNAEYASAQDQIETLQGRCERLESQLAESFVEIGKLRDELEASIEKIRDAYRQLKASQE